MFLGLIFLLIVGAGGWSLDALLARKMAPGKNKDAYPVPHVTRTSH
jgi:hypothetical protein